MMKRIQSIVSEHGLIDLPGEGGYYRETDRDKREADYEGFDGKRNLSTSIYFAMTKDKFSAWHRIKNREEWNFHTGVDVKLHKIDANGEYSCIILGNSIEAVGYKTVIEPGTWFAAEIIEREDLEPDYNYTLVTCFCVPGFEFKDFELGNHDTLLELYGSNPECADAIRRLAKKLEPKVSITEQIVRAGSPVYSAPQEPSTVGHGTAHDIRPNASS